MSTAAQYSPLEIFAAACVTGACQWHLGFVPLHDVVDGLQIEAERAGFDVDTAQWVMSEAFRPYRTAPMSETFEAEREDAKVRKQGKRARAGNGDDQRRERFGDRHLIRSSAEFTAGFVPPDYLVDGVLQRRFCYALTATTNTGKTAILLLITALVALGRPIGDRDVSQGRVLFLSGENPDDVRMRWIAMSQQLDFDIGTIDVNFTPALSRFPN